MKISPRSCRHCGSPAKGNPCWWDLTHPGAASLGDLPCWCDLEDGIEERRRRKYWIAFAITGTVIAAAAAANFL